MSFETALVTELTAVSGLTAKVFPINATEGTAAPYLVYLSNEGLYDKTLLGYLSSREVDCELNIFHSSYSSLKTLVILVIAKLQTFQSRSIGSSGPYIQNITLSKPVELWEPELKLWRCNIEITVKF